MIKDEEHYREQLWKLVEDYSPIDIELYRELRGLYDGKSWLQQQGSYFAVESCIRADR